MADSRCDISLMVRLFCVQAAGRTGGMPAADLDAQILAAAGYAGVTVRPGKADSPFAGFGDPDLPMNPVSGKDVLGPDGKRDLEAVAWLNRAYELAAGAGAATRLADHVRRSQPFAPIFLTRDGDTLACPPERRSRYAVHRLDDDPFLPGPAVGDHSCGGALRLVALTPATNVLVCPRCLLRLPLPSSVVTYGELRACLSP